MFAVFVANIIVQFCLAKSNSYAVRNDVNWCSVLYLETYRSLTFQAVFENHLLKHPILPKNVANGESINSQSSMRSTLNGNVRVQAITLEVLGYAALGCAALGCAVLGYAALGCAVLGYVALGYVALGLDSLGLDSLGLD
jgi:hypothetical protein